MPFFSRIKTQVVHIFSWCEPDHRLQRVQRRSLKIGYPTDFSRGDFTIDGLAENQKAIIRERAIQDATFPDEPQSLYSPSGTSFSCRGLSSGKTSSESSTAGSTLSPKPFCEDPREVPPRPVRIARSVSLHSVPVPFGEYPREVPPIPAKMSRSASSPTLRNNSAETKRQTLYQPPSIDVLPRSRPTSQWQPLSLTGHPKPRPNSILSSPSSAGYPPSPSRYPPSPVGYASSVFRYPPRPSKARLPHSPLGSPASPSRIPLPPSPSYSCPRSLAYNGTPSLSIHPALRPKSQYGPRTSIGSIKSRPASLYQPQTPSGLPKPRPNSTNVPRGFEYLAIYEQEIVKNADHVPEPLLVTEPRNWNEKPRMQGFEEQIVKGKYPYEKSVWSTGSCSSFCSSVCDSEDGGNRSVIESKSESETETCASIIEGGML